MHIRRGLGDIHTSKAEVCHCCFFCFVYVFGVVIDQLTTNTSFISVTPVDINAYPRKIGKAAESAKYSIFNRQSIFQYS